MVVTRSRAASRCDERDQLDDSSTQASAAAVPESRRLDCPPPSVAGSLPVCGAPDSPSQGTPTPRGRLSAEESLVAGMSTDRESPMSRSARGVSAERATVEPVRVSTGGSSVAIEPPTLAAVDSNLATGATDIARYFGLCRARLDMAAARVALFEAAMKSGRSPVKEVGEILGQYNLREQRSPEHDESDSELTSRPSEEAREVMAAPPPPRRRYEPAPARSAVHPQGAEPAGSYRPGPHADPYIAEGAQPAGRYRQAAPTDMYESKDYSQGTKPAGSYRPAVPADIMCVDVNYAQGTQPAGRYRQAAPTEIMYKNVNDPQCAQPAGSYRPAAHAGICINVNRPQGVQPTGSYRSGADTNACNSHAENGSRYNTAHGRDNAAFVRYAFAESGMFVPLAPAVPPRLSARPAPSSPPPLPPRRRQLERGFESASEVDFAPRRALPPIPTENNQPGTSGRDEYDSHPPWTGRRRTAGVGSPPPVPPRRPRSAFCTPPSNRTNMCSDVSDGHRRTRTLPIQEGQRRQQITEQAGMPLRRGHPLQPRERQESRRNDVSPPGDMSQVRVEFTDRPPSEALRPAFDSRARPPTPPPRVESAGRRHPPDAPPALYGQAGYALLPDEPSAAQDKQEQRLWAPSPLRREDPPCRSPLPAPRPVIGSRQDMPPTADSRVKSVQWAQPCSSFRKEDHDMTQSPSQLNDSRYREPWSSTLAAPPSAGPAPRSSDPYHEPPVMAGARYAPCEDGGHGEPMGGLARMPARSGDLTVNDLAKAIMQASRSSGNGGAPRYLVELPVFTGAASDWLHFRAAFRESAPYLSIAENSARLRKALRGQAFEEINCLFLSGTHPEDIVRRLETRFGRPDALVLAEMGKLKTLPRMTDEPHNVCAFASRVINIVGTVQALGRTSHLHSPEMSRLIEEKMTPIIKSRWFDYDMSASDSAPTLCKLASFLELESERNSRHARQEVARPEFRRDPRHVRINVASDNVEERSPRRISNRDTPRIFPLARNKRECPICKASHAVATCPQFKKETIDARWEIAKRLRLCFRCLELHNWKHKCKGGCKVAGCRNPSHNTVLHQPRSPTAGTAVVSTAWGASRTAFLKVVPVVVAGPKGEVETYALLDDGSTVTLVTDETATAVGAEGPSEPFVIEAVGGAHIDAGTSRRVQIQIKGKYMGAPTAVLASTIPSLDISGQSVDKRDIEDCAHLADIKDELQYLNAIPTILVGQDNWQLLQARDTRMGLKHQPVASMTELGWVLHGVKGTPLGRANVTQKVHRVTTNLDEQLREHFALESLGIRPQRPKSDPDERAEKILRESINQLPDGSYEVGLPWKREDVQLPDSYRAALNRLAGVEKKMNRNEEYGKRYTEQIDRMLAEGYAEEAPASASPDRTWYLPHFGVDNPAKKKLRIVHDAAAQVRGVCLNDALLTGPDLLESLPGVLMRFRQHPVAVTADIKDMFLRIKVQNTDRDALRFLWRKKPHETPISYRMTSVIFGATSSPFTAMFVKNYNAEKHGSENPQAIKSIKRNHYMDDYLESFRSIEEARQTAGDVATIHGKGKFSLQRWTATHPAVVADLVSGESPPEALTHQLMNDSEKILGIIWNPKDDFLTYNLNFVKVQKSLLEGTRVPTKRELLSAAMSLYDPLGLVAPVTIQPKHTLQKTWSEGLDWDDPLPEGLHAEWMQWLESVRALKNLKLPRAYRGYSDAGQVELHTFVDASERAYAAAVYWRAVGADGGVQISLAAAKARVAGKVTSIPRLELQAAVLGARLARSVENEHETVVSARHFWSDSTTVLAWLRTGAKAYKPFVAHRIAELEETTKSGEWHWLPTADNVADDATRGIPPHFDSEHRWFAGPGFLYQPPDTWPSQPPTGCGGSGEERISRIDIVESRPRVTESLPDPTRFSSWTRLLRTAARVLQFVDKCRKRAVDKVCVKRTRARAEKDPTWRITKRPCKDRSVPISHISPENYVPLSADLLQRARCLLLQASQETHFSEERLLLDGGSTVDRSSRLFNLPVKIDKSKLIVINSRIQAADRLTPAQGQPVVVDGDDYTIRLYLRHVHTSFHHGGTELIVNEVRQQFHVLRLRPNVKRVIKECQPCRLRRALPPEPPTGMLPGARLAHHRRPFTYTGVDYFGPIKVTVGRSIQNRYVALFTCLTTRAIHLEVAGSLSTDAAVNALRRLMSRRGCPTELWSDNGTNFHGADKELRAAALAATQQAAEIRAIRWRFIPPGAPFMGGAWERLVRSVKTALAVTVAHHRPSEDTLATLLSEAEHTVNSRPLTHVAVGALDEPALTPMHFILGGPSSVPLPGKFNESDMSSKRHWRAAQRLADMFWDRWTREALPLMRLPQQTHGKGDKVEVGDIVLVVDNNAPRNQWRRAIVTRTFPGTDGVVRTVEIRMDNRTLLRPARKVVVLPVKKMMSSPAERSEDQPAA